MTFANINGTQIAYEISGQGDPLVFVHAGIADQRMWRAQIAHFGSRFQAITLDLRGFGQSHKPDAPFAHYCDVGALLAQLGIQRAHLVGASLGGAAVIDLALTQPELPASLVLVGSALSGYKFQSDEVKFAWRAMEAAGDAGQREQVAELETNLWVVGSNRNPDAVDSTIRDYVCEVLLASYDFEEIGDEQALEPPAIDRLDEITAPTQIIVGHEDVADIQTVSEVLLRGIPNAEITIIGGVAHLPNMEKPDVFNWILTDFLRAHPLSTPTPLND